MRNGWPLLVIVGTLIMLLVSAGTAVADYEPITDLPFYREKGGVELTCGWHQNCIRSAGYDPSKGAIDLGMFGGETVYAAGHGDIEAGGPSGNCLGNTVTVDHGSETSLYAHLSAWFWSKGETPLCRHVALGAVGNSTCPVSEGFNPHLHFGGDDASHFTPIRGRRSRNKTYDDVTFQFDPYPPAPTPEPSTYTLFHDGVQTLAYTVDDDQGRGERQEMWVYPEHEDADSQWVRHEGGGFGYWGMPRASYYSARIPATDPDHYAYWNPFLPVRDVYAIYAFIPNAKVNVTASMAEYSINYITNGGRIGSDVALLDQGDIVESGKGNEWHRLVGSGGRETWPGGTLGGRWSERLLNVYLRDGRDCGGENDCAIEHMAADALLFVPSSCGR